MILISRPRRVLKKLWGFIMGGFLMLFLISRVSFFFRSPVNTVLLNDISRDLSDIRNNIRKPPIINPHSFFNTLRGLEINIIRRVYVCKRNSQKNKNSKYEKIEEVILDERKNVNLIHCLEKNYQNSYHNQRYYQPDRK